MVIKLNIESNSPIVSTLTVIYENYIYRVEILCIKTIIIYYKQVQITNSFNINSNL